MKFSVLLSVYHKEKPHFLEKAVSSVINQTVRPNEIVLVKDGPIGSKLNEVIKVFIDSYPDLFNIIELKHNKGLGKALSIGINNCKYDLIARMDTDDIAKKNRFEKQIELFRKHPNLDIVGSWVDEFQDEITNVLSKRKVPETSKQIMEFSKKRNPFNHPTVMYKKKAVLEAGNYIDFYLNEDYYLWLRMLKKGFKGYNIQESLLYFRVNSDTFKRRGGIKYAYQDIKLQNEILKLGLINKFEYIKNIILRTTVRVLPNIIRQYIYKKLLR